MVRGAVRGLIVGGCRETEAAGSRGALGRGSVPTGRDCTACGGGKAGEGWLGEAQKLRMDLVSLGIRGGSEKKKERQGRGEDVRGERERRREVDSTAWKWRGREGDETDVRGPRGTAGTRCPPPAGPCTSLIALWSRPDGWTECRAPTQGAQKEAKEKSRA